MLELPPLRERLDDLPVLAQHFLDKVTRESMTAFESAVQHLDAVVEVLRMMGQPDYLMRVVAADAEAFEAVYIDHLAELPHVKTLTSQSAMKVVKRTHVLPIPSR